jgi:hypothetical protein
VHSVYGGQQVGHAKVWQGGGLQGGQHVVKHEWLMVVSMSLKQCLVAACLHLCWKGICNVTYAYPVAHVRRRARRPFIWQRQMDTRTWWTCCWMLELKLMHQARSACPCWPVACGCSSAQCKYLQCTMATLAVPCFARYHIFAAVQPLSCVSWRATSPAVQRCTACLARTKTISTVVCGLTSDIYRLPGVCCCGNELAVVPCSLF